MGKVSKASHAKALRPEVGVPDHPESCYRDIFDDLGAKKNLLKTIFATTPDLLVLKNENLVYQAANPAFCEFLGLSEDEILGRTDFDLFPAAEADRYRQDDLRVMASGQQLEQDEEVTGAQGKTWLQVIKTPIRDEGGKLAGVLCSVRDISARKQAQEALEATEVKYRTIFDSANDGLALLDIETGNFLDVNRKFCEMSGYALEEAASLSLDLFCSDTPPFTRADAWNWMQSALEEGPQLFEWFTRDKQGRPLWLEVNLQHSVIGGRDHLLAIARNVSERKRGEAALRESQKRFRQFAENIDAIFWMRSPDSSQIFYANSAYERIWGRSVQSLFEDPKSWLEVVHPADQDRMAERRLRGDLGDEEFRIIRADGEIRWVNARLFPILDDEGKTYRVAGICVDVTERKRAEEAFKETAGMLQTLIQASPLAIVALDRQHRVRLWNPAAERIFGWKAAEALGRPAPYVPEDKREEFYTMVEGEFQGHFHYAVELCRMRKGGSPLDVCLWSSPLFDAQGEIIGAMGMFADITARKEAEKTADDIRRQQEAILSNIPDIAWLKDKDCRLIAVNEPYGKSCGTPPKDLVGKTDRDIWPPDLARRYREDDLEVMRTRQRKRVEEPMVDKRRGLRWIETIKTPILNEQGEVIGTTGIARDITERRKVAETLRKTSRALKAITECDQAMMRATNEAELLNEICRIIVEVGGYRMAWVGFAEADDKKTVRPVALKGYDAGYLQEIEVSWADTVPGQGPVGRAIRNAKPAIVRNVKDDPSFAHWRAEALKRGYASVLGLPLKDKQTFGALAIYASEANAFDAEELGLLVGLANDLAYGISALRASNEHQRAERALRESERKLRFLTSQILTAQEEERKRVSRELHDELGQSLSVLKYHLVSIENKLRRDQQGLKNDCEHLQGHVDDIIENVRRLSWDLSPSILEDLGLSSSLRYLVDEICQGNNMGCAIQMDEINNLFAPAAQINIYRIFQESLTNIVKHAQATCIAVNIKKQIGQVSFSLQDNGKGFSLDQRLPGKVSKRLGVTAMHERARMVGGSLHIWSKKGKGTKITFTIPIDFKGN